MDDLVRRTDVIELIKAVPAPFPHEEWMRIKILGLAVSKAPAVDAEPVLHGQWEWYEEWSQSTTDHYAECDDCGWRCSECKNALSDMVGGYWDDPDEKPKINRCPDCGTKMDSVDVICSSDQTGEVAPDFFNSLEQHIGELTKKVPKWIDVNEQLPEHFKRVLVVREGADGPIVEQGFKDVGDWWKVYGTRTKKVFFWMPLPEPPEVEA